MTRTHYIILGALIFVLGALCGFFIGKGMYQTEPSVIVERDTIHVVDTVKYYLPSPMDSIRTKYITRWMTVHDTTMAVVEHTDTVQVDVPITSKHYSAKEYDAWVSGFEPSLDSIRVYREKEYITEHITVTKAAKRKPWGIGFSGGYGYDFSTKTASPFIGVGISYDIISF